MKCSFANQGLQIGGGTQGVKHIISEKSNVYVLKVYLQEIVGFSCLGFYLNVLFIQNNQQGYMELKRSNITLFADSM